VTKESAAREEAARLHAEIAQREQQLEGIVRSVPGIVWEAWGRPDAEDQRTTFISDYVETLVGYSVAEWQAMPCFWLSIVDREDRETVKTTAAEQFSSGNGGRMEFRWLHKDGRRVWVDA